MDGGAVEVSMVEHMPQCLGMVSKQALADRVMNLIQINARYFAVQGCLVVKDMEEVWVLVLVVVDSPNRRQQLSASIRQGRKAAVPL